MIDESLIGHVTETIVERFNPRRVVLFGSQARGDAVPESDLDLFVEMETTNRRESAVAIQSVFGLHDWPMDIIVFTPEDVAQWTGQVGTILYDVEHEGRVLYDRRGPVAMSIGDPPHPAYHAWLEKADSDLLVVETCLAAPRTPWDEVCFHAQQSAEKVLKGLLIFHGQQPRKTHKLEEVLPECVAYEPTSQSLHADCVSLSPYGVDPRYPDLSSGPDEQAGQAAVAAMQRIRAAVPPLLPK